MNQSTINNRIYRNIKSKMDDNYLIKKEKQPTFTKKTKDRQSISIAPTFKCPLADLL